MNTTLANMLVESNYLIQIPTDSQELASLLWNYSTDWAEALEFVDRYCKSQGIVIKKQEVIEIIKTQYLGIEE